jgi:hypothetical protein
MKIQTALVLLIAEFFLSCSGYEKESVSRVELVRLDSIFRAGQVKGESWAKSPRDFCLRQFPSMSIEGQSSYTFEEDSAGENQRTIKVKEEGALDDEVLGEQYKLEFELKGGVWRVTSYDVFVKRRH